MGLQDLLDNQVIRLILVIVVGATIITAGLVNAYSASIGSALTTTASLLSLGAIIWLFMGGGLSGKRN